MATFTTLIALICFLLTFSVTGQSSLRDQTIKNDTIPKSDNKNAEYFKVLTGGMNALYNDNNASGSFDLAVQTFHYYLITGRRNKNDSIHKSLIGKGKPISKIYNGVHFSMLNRTSIDFDSIRSLANDYITSLRPSPITMRIRKELFLTKQNKISSLDYSPVLSLIITGDGRAVPYIDRKKKVKMGASAHLYVTFSSVFKRLEFDDNGKQIDQGSLYFKPSFGIAYATHLLRRSVTEDDMKIPLMTTECKIGFNSEKNQINDFAFLFSYTLNEIYGPKFRAGVILTSIK
mgnify:CR=1 FL=1